MIKLEAVDLTCVASRWDLQAHMLEQAIRVGVRVYPRGRDQSANLKSYFLVW